MRNHNKQRSVGTKGGLDQRIDEPNLSGAFIRSLVKQLTSSRSHTINTVDIGGGLKPTSKTAAGEDHVAGTQAASMNMDSHRSEKKSPVHGQSKNSCHTVQATPCQDHPTRNDHRQEKNSVNDGKVGDNTQTVAQQPQLKKQVRRRPHTRRPSQECLLNIAEARREIVNALHLHRAATGASKLGANSIDPKAEKTRIIKSPKSPSRNSNRNPQAANNRCNSCIRKSGYNHRANEAKAITICGHLLCWICLGEWLQLTSPVKDCPVCAKPLTGNDVIPITLGVPILLPASQEIMRTSSAVLQSAPLLINPLPLPQPAWSTTGPSLVPMQSINISPGMISQNQVMATPLYQTQENSNVMVEPSCLPSTICTSPSFGPIENTISNMPNTEQDCCIKSWHVAMDDDELAEIRSLGEQHEMEWSDTVNLATSTWWFKFLKTSEYPDNLYQTDCIDKNDNFLEKLLEQPLSKYGINDSFPQLFEDSLQECSWQEDSTTESLSNILIPELPTESQLWPSEWDDYNEILQFDGNIFHECMADQSANSEILSEAKKSACQESSDYTAMRSDLTSENPDINPRFSSEAGDKRKRDS
eukprot:Gb_25950 [translate_table: standard]